MKDWFASNLNFDVELVFFEGIKVGIDAESGSLGKSDFAILIRRKFDAGEVAAQWRWIKWIFAKVMVFETGVRLDGSAEGEVSSEGVVHELNVLSLRVIGDLFGGGDSTNAASVDLNETDARIINQVFGLVKVVAAFAAGESNGAGLGGQLLVGAEGTGDKRLFEPMSTRSAKGRETFFGEGDLVIPNCSGVDEENSIGTQSIAGGLDLVLIFLDGILAIRTPAEFGGANAGARNLLSPAKGGLRIAAEKLGGVSDFRESLIVPEKLINRLAEIFAHEIPEGNVDAGKGMIRLKEIEGVGANEPVDAADVFRGFDSLPEDRRAERFASAVRHRAIPTGDGGQGGGFTFAPTGVAASQHANEESVLAAIANVEDLRDGKVKEINGFDSHLDGKRMKHCQPGRQVCLTDEGRGLRVSW